MVRAKDSQMRARLRFTGANKIGCFAFYFPSFYSLSDVSNEIKLYHRLGIRSNFFPPCSLDFSRSINRTEVKPNVISSIYQRIADVFNCNILLSIVEDVNLHVALNWSTKWFSSCLKIT